MISCELTEANHLKHFKVQKTCDFLLKYDQFHINLFTEILCTEWAYLPTNNFKAICTFKFGIVFQVHITSLQLHILKHLPIFPESLTHHLVSLNKYKWPMYKQEVLFFSFTKDANCNNKYIFFSNKFLSARHLCHFETCKQFSSICHLFLLYYTRTADGRHSNIEKPIQKALHMFLDMNYLL